MKVKEPISTYNAMPSTSVMRGRLIKAFEDEEDENFIQRMYIMMVRMRNEEQTERSTKYSLSELKGILSINDDDKASYDDIRMNYMKH